MEGILRVTPQQLQSTASEFSNQGNTISQLTSQMTDLVNALSSFWTGEAAEAFKAKYTGLSDDIQRMIKMVQEHVTDLNEMAQQYITAEQSSEDLIANLSADVIV